MIPILYEKNEISFVSNGLGRLTDCISCKVTEERNGCYECDFTYPITGSLFEEITCGRIVGVTHEDSDDVQPFDIVTHSKPINGIVSFHCTHISYRQSMITVNTSNVRINSLADALTLIKNETTPENPFTYWTNKSSEGYLGTANGIPRTARQMLGGIQGSILDAYGGEWEFDKFQCKLWDSRGTNRDFSIRYGVNLLDYTDDLTIEGTYSKCIPYWTNGTELQAGDVVTAKGKTVTDRDECVPLDLSQNFESLPTAEQLNKEAARVIASRTPFNPTQTLKVSFVRLQELGYEEYTDLYNCNLCDLVTVIFPDYEMAGKFKIVKTVWDVLSDRYDSMELGSLSVSLAQALGIDNLNSSTYNPGAEKYLPLTGGTITGDLNIDRSGNYAGVNLFAQSSGQSTNYGGYLRMYSQGQATPYGLNGVLQTGGNLFIGSGESPANHYALYENNGEEKTYITADENVYIQCNGNTIANRRGLVVWQSGNNTIISPAKEDTLFNGTNSSAENGYYLLGAENYRWYGVYANTINASGNVSGATFNGFGVGGTNTGWWAKIPVIKSDGVMEVGKYIDFHTSNTGTDDYNTRLTAHNGKLCVEGDLEVSLDTSAASTTTDGALYAAITALGWQSAVID